MRAGAGGLTAKVFAFLTHYGAASSGFIADHYQLAHPRIASVCWRQRRAGTLRTREFDGHLLYELSEPTQDSKPTFALDSGGELDQNR